MPQEPKKRHSRQRQGKRRAAIKLTVLRTVICTNCGKSIPSHKVCKYCGFYKGKRVVNTAKREKKEEKTKSGQT